MQNDSSPTQTLVEYEAEPISRRRAAELWILAIVLSAPVPIVVWYGVLSVMLSKWSALANAVLMTAILLVAARTAWRVRATHMNPLTGEDPQAEALETRAMPQALERYDRVLAEAQAGAAGEGESDQASRPEESGDERVAESAADRYESAARRYELAARRSEAALAARMRERGDTE